MFSVLTFEVIKYMCMCLCLNKLSYYKICLQLNGIFIILSFFCTVEVFQNFIVMDFKHKPGDYEPKKSNQT